MLYHEYSEQVERISLSNFSKFVDPLLLQKKISVVPNTVSIDFQQSSPRSKVSQNSHQYSFGKKKFFPYPLRNFAKPSSKTCIQNFPFPLAEQYDYRHFTERPIRPLQNSLQNPLQNFQKFQEKPISLTHRGNQGSLTSQPTSNTLQAKTMQAKAYVPSVQINQKKDFKRVTNSSIRPKSMTLKKTNIEEFFEEEKLSGWRKESKNPTPLYYSSQSHGFDEKIPSFYDESNSQIIVSGTPLFPTKQIFTS